MTDEDDYHERTIIVMNKKKKERGALSRFITGIGRWAVTPTKKSSKAKRLEA